MKVLLAEADDSSRAALEAMLPQMGHQAISTTDGHQAWEILRRGQFDVVIADWDLPGMRCSELLRAIRERCHWRHAYLLVIVEGGKEEDVSAALRAGADDYIEQPVRRLDLMVRIRTGERILSLGTRDLVILAMAKLAESRDPETGNHLNRIQIYSRELAEELLKMGGIPHLVDEEFVETIYLTSALHDIGKVGIPDSILLKPGLLSDSEFEIMKTHTTIGYKTLSNALQHFPSATFLRMSADIAYAHHERFNGTGYPQGLPGEDIPLSARIVALADVYDALTSRRTYKEPLSHDVVVSMIREDSGVHFDPVVVQAFLERHENFRRVRGPSPEALILDSEQRAPSSPEPAIIS